MEPTTVALRNAVLAAITRPYDYHVLDGVLDGALAEARSAAVAPLEKALRELLNAAEHTHRMNQVTAALDVGMAHAWEALRLAAAPAVREPESIEAAMVAGLQEDADRDRALVAEWEPTLPPLEPEGLDVERLRLALDNLWERRWGPLPLPPSQTTVNLENAEAIAAEYARLANLPERSPERNEAALRQLDNLGIGFGERGLDLERLAQAMAFPKAEPDQLDRDAAALVAAEYARLTPERPADEVDG